MTGRVQASLAAAAAAAAAAGLGCALANAPQNRDVLLSQVSSVTAHHAACKLSSATAPLWRHLAATATRIGDLRSRAAQVGLSAASPAARRCV